MTMPVLGLDTSNYTTSAAVFDGADGCNAGRLLAVRPGELGLRQSDALFQHVKQLPALLEELEGRGLLRDLKAVGASTRPRTVEAPTCPASWWGRPRRSCWARPGVSRWSTSPTSKGISRRHCIWRASWIGWSRSSLLSHALGHHRGAAGAP